MLTNAERQEYQLLLLRRRAATRTLAETEQRFAVLELAISAPEMVKAREEAERIEAIAAASA